MAGEAIVNTLRYPDKLLKIHDRNDAIKNFFYFLFPFLKAHRQIIDFTNNIKQSVYSSPVSTGGLNCFRMF